MYKKVLFVALLSFGLVFSKMARQCFADALAQLEQVETYKWYPAQAKAIYQAITKEHPGTDYALKAHKNLVISYLSAKRDAEAQQTLDKLVEDFSGHSGLPEALYDIARIYERSRKYEKAKSIYQQIIQQYPDSSCANETQLAFPRLEVLSHIESKNYSTAQSAIDSLTTNFSGYSGLPSSLYDIARMYERAKRYKEAKGVYQRIIQQHPGSSSADRARLAVARISIFSLIESRGYSEVQAAIDSLITDFPGHSDLSESLYDIAGKYEGVKAYEDAKRIYQQLIHRYPDSSHAGRAQLIIPKISIFSLVESGQTKAVQAALDKLIADFSGHSYLPSVLHDIARKYERLEKYEEAESIYQKIAQDYPESSYAGKAELGVAKGQILLFIDSGQTEAAQAAIDKLLCDFREDSRLSWYLLRIGGQHYDKACRLELEGLRSEAKDHFMKAIAVWEKTIQELPVSTATAPSCHLAARCYSQLGEYEKAIEYCNKIVDNWPGYKNAWDAQFMIARYYEKLESSGRIPTAEAAAQIRHACEELLADYPDSPVVQGARELLKRWDFNNIKQ